MASCLIDCSEGVAHAALVGELDIFSSTQIGERLEKLDAFVLLLDMSAVTFFDASALRMLTGLRRKFGPGLTIASPSDAVTRVFDLTSTSDRFSRVA